MRKTPCQSLLEGLPICSMSMRPWPTEVVDGGLFRVLDPGEWPAPGKPEACRCHTPELEHVLSPLGVPIEVLYGSPEHYVCRRDRRPAVGMLRLCRVELQAESLYVTGARFWLGSFDLLIEQSLSAQRHILGLPDHTAVPERIELAKDTVRTIIARHAAVEAVKKACKWL